jgi:hypothetical protein
LVNTNVISTLTHIIDWHKNNEIIQKQAHGAMRFLMGLAHKAMKKWLPRFLCIACSTSPGRSAWMIRVSMDLYHKALSFNSCHWMKGIHRVQYLN